MLLVLTGCPGPSQPVDPDGPAPSDGNQQDGPPGEGGLRIEWATNPEVPGTTEGGNKLDDVRFRMENLKATVDVDPLDPNTSRAEVKLRWDETHEPEILAFPNAPAGRYTSIVLKLDEGDLEAAFDLRGGEDDATFRIVDTTSLPITMACNFVLLPNETKTIEIEIDVQPAIDALDIETLPSGSGADHHLDGDDPGMVAFRAALASSFRVKEK